jgi:RimJ/RimL family protein N-acetyltransferase
VHLPGNEASARVLRKIGMREQGMVDYNGTPVHLFALDRQEWDHLRPPLQ